MNSETKVCQNCKSSFTIEPDDFTFYEKIKVPPPTFCPECRMLRRFVWRNERNLFRRKDSSTGKEIFSGYPPQVEANVRDLEYWWSDKFEGTEYGRDYDFSKPFFEQFRELLYTVPWPARSVLNLVNSDYSEQSGWLKNCYLCFNTGELENAAYCVTAFSSKDCLDLYEARHSELCYENYMSDEAYRVFFSVNCEECTDVWFSKNLLGCSYCFGCVNLRNKSYHIFNKPYSKEDYFSEIKKWDTGSYKTKEELVGRAREFWIHFPMRFTLAIRVVNSTGEHIERSKNLKNCYSIHEGENMAYCQFLEPPAADSYDYTNFGRGASRMYESVTCGIECAGLKFCWECWPSSTALEYSAFCRSSKNLFGCVSLKKKEYCVLNKQCTKEEYEALIPKIKAHMDAMPYSDKKGNVYKYGEFFPAEFSPFAYNETMADDFFPLSEEEAAGRGFLWREQDKREYNITVNAKNLPDNIKDADDSVLKEIIKCASCGGAYRIIQMELDFYRRLNLPLPRLCVNCRYKERFKNVKPPKLWPGKCQCAGTKSKNGVYKNEMVHFHGAETCPNEFATSYAPGRPEIIYCEACYNSEVA